MTDAINTVSNHKPRKGCSPRGYFIAILVVFGLIILVWWMGASLIVSDPLENSDAIVILSGGKTDRLAGAVELFNAGYSSRIIVTQASEDYIDPESQANFGKIMPLVHMGVPQDAIVVTKYFADSTVGEATAVLNKMSYFGWKSCIIVTDSFHTLRSKIIFSQTFKGSGITISMYPVTTEWYRKSNWWMSRVGISTAAIEWVKLIGYLIGIR
jgi:uncharacterized SAM-binding protein YcdF (DUF218 family)